jgi:hypothetical protein
MVVSMKPKVEVLSQWPPEVGETHVSVRESIERLCLCTFARKKDAAVGEKDRFVAMKAVGSTRLRLVTPTRNRYSGEKSLIRISRYSIGA